MEENQKILRNISGEIPKGQKTILTVSDIENPNEKLENAKKILIGFLENQDLEDNDPQWKSIMPAAFISFLDKLDEEDFGNDESLASLELIINDFKNKNWEWHSSKIIQKGFKIVFKDSFYPKYSHFIHSLNIPISNIWFEDDRFGDYYFHIYNDVTNYKKLE